MGLWVCEECQARVAYDDRNTDFVHECQTGDDVIDKEPVLVIGDYTDSTSWFASQTTTQVEPSQIFVGGTENTLFGTEEAAQGERERDLNVFGLSKTAYRLRTKSRYVDVSKREKEVEC